VKVYLDDGREINVAVLSQAEIDHKMELVQQVRETH
jgi:hypothetical protein